MCLFLFCFLFPCYLCQLCFVTFISLSTHCDSLSSLRTTIRSIYLHPNHLKRTCGRALVQRREAGRNRAYITRHQPFVLHSRPLFSSAFTAKEGLGVSAPLINLQNRGYIRNPTFCYIYFVKHSH